MGWTMLELIQEKSASPLHGRSQGGQKDHAPKISTKSSHFVL